MAGQAAGGIQAHPVADGRHLRHTWGAAIGEDFGHGVGTPGAHGRWERA